MFISPHGSSRKMTGTSPSAGFLRGSVAAGLLFIAAHVLFPFASLSFSRLALCRDSLAMIALSLFVSLSRSLYYFFLYSTTREAELYAINLSSFSYFHDIFVSFHQIRLDYRWGCEMVKFHNVSFLYLYPSFLRNTVIPVILGQTVTVFHLSRRMGPKECNSFTLSS